MEAVLVRGSLAAPYLEFPELSLISYVKTKEKYLGFEPRTGTGQASDDMYINLSAIHVFDK
jgi:hypothetical protein